MARKLFQTYDKDMHFLYFKLRNRNIDKEEVDPMIAEAYKALNKVYNPKR